MFLPVFGARKPAKLRKSASEAPRRRCHAFACDSLGRHLPLWNLGFQGYSGKELGHW